MADVTISVLLVAKRCHDGELMTFGAKTLRLTLLLHGVGGVGRGPLSRALACFDHLDLGLRERDGVVGHHKD